MRLTQLIKDLHGKEQNSVDDRPHGCYEYYVPSIGANKVIYNYENKMITACSSTYPCVTTDNAVNNGVCARCAAGKFRYGSSYACVDCRSGYFSYDGASGNQLGGHCTSPYGCGSNYKYGCQYCGTGRYNTGDTASQYSGQPCSWCPRGKYNSQEASTTCDWCPSGKSTYSTGTSSSSSCNYCYYFCSYSCSSVPNCS